MTYFGLSLKKNNQRYHLINQINFTLRPTLNIRLMLNIKLLFHIILSILQLNLKLYKFYIRFEA